jgi:hypothetical protein
MRVRALVCLCCLAFCSGCKTWSWSPSEWFSASAAAPAANSTAAAAPAVPATEGLAGSGHGQTLQLGRPISTAMPEQPVQPGRPTAQPPRYLPPQPPVGQVPAKGGASFRPPSGDAMTLNVPPTHRGQTAAVTASKSTPAEDETAPRVAGNVAESPPDKAKQTGSPAADDTEGRWKSAWQGWDSASPQDNAPLNEPIAADPVETPAAVAHTQVDATSPRQASEVRENPAAEPPGKTSSALQVPASKSSANRGLPQQPITIQTRPL